MMLDDRPTVADVARLANIYWRIPGNGCGGRLHVVLESGWHMSLDGALATNRPDYTYPLYEFRSPVVFPEDGGHE